MHQQIITNAPRWKHQDEREALDSRQAIDYPLELRLSPIQQCLLGVCMASVVIVVVVVVDNIHFNQAELSQAATLHNFLSIKVAHTNTSH